MLATASAHHHSTMAFPTFSLIQQPISPPSSCSSVPMMDSCRYEQLHARQSSPSTTTTMALHQHHHPTEVSFSWSDFPIDIAIDDDFFVMRNHPPSVDFSARYPLTKNNKRNFHDGGESSSSSSSSTTPTTKTSTTTTPKKSVRFAPSLEVRTYSVVLGDHPWCEDGLALELGWEYSTSTQETHQKQSIITTNSNINSNSEGLPHRYSYMERKRLLLEVGGYTREELEANDWSDVVTMDTTTTTTKTTASNSEKQHELYKKHQLSRVGSITNSLSHFATVV